MVDTVTFTGFWPLRQPLPSRRKLGLAPGVKCWVGASGEVLESVECSLPKLLFGHNGRVIESQSQIDRALAKLVEILSRIACMPDVTEWRVSRVDMVWNYNLPALALITAHAALRVPGFGLGANLFNGGQTVSWRAWRSQLILTFYNKSKQMHVPGSVLRAEISLRGNQLNRRLNGQNWSDFSVLYGMYRGIMVRIPAIQSPGIAANLQEAIGCVPLAYRQQIFAQVAHKPGRTRRRWRQRSEAYAARLSGTFHWEKILPKDGPPKAVCVTPKVTRRVAKKIQALNNYA